MSKLKLLKIISTLLILLNIFCSDNKSENHKKNLTSFDLYQTIFSHIQDNAKNNLQIDSEIYNSSEIFTKSKLELPGLLDSALFIQAKQCRKLAINNFGNNRPIFSLFFFSFGDSTQQIVQHSFKNLFGNLDVKIWNKYYVSFL